MQRQAGRHVGHNFLDWMTPEFVAALGPAAELPPFGFAGEPSFANDASTTEESGETAGRAERVKAAFGRLPQRCPTARVSTAVPHGKAGSTRSAAWVTVST